MVNIYIRRKWMKGIWELFVRVLQLYVSQNKILTGKHKKGKNTTENKRDAKNYS